LAPCGAAVPLRRPDGGIMDITLKNISPRQLQLLGDAAMQSGDATLAAGFYRHLVRLTPKVVENHARLGLTQRPNARTLKMLEVIQTLEASFGGSVFVGEGLATWLKRPPFIADAKFMEIAARDFEIAPAGISNWHWNLS